MRKTEIDRFIFSASAQSIGAALQHPSKAFFTEAPGASLPVNGGHISHSKENLRFTIDTVEILRVGRASSTVLGEQRDDHWVTVATATVEKLNVLDIVTADRVVAKVTSIYPIRQKGESGSIAPRFLANLLPNDHDYYPSRFFVSGSHFDNLKIDGRPYDCFLDPPETEHGFRVSKVESTQEPLFKEACRSIHLPQFGVVHLGEKYKYGGKVIVNMLRIELGCGTSGSIGGPQAYSNGKNA